MSRVLEVVGGPRRRQHVPGREFAAVPLPSHVGPQALACPKYYFCQVQYGMELFRRSGMPLEPATLWSGRQRPRKRWCGSKNRWPNPKRPGTVPCPPRARNLQRRRPSRRAFRDHRLPRTHQITVVERDAAFGAYLVEEAKRFWMDMYAPRHILKQQKQIEDGEVDVAVTIEPTEPVAKKQKRS